MRPTLAQILFDFFSDNEVIKGLLWLRQVNEIEVNLIGFIEN
jgi:hypothetical protein